MKISTLLKTTFRILTIGLFVGFFVALFQFCTVHLQSFLYDVFVQRITWKIIVFFIALPIIIFYSYIFNKTNSNINGGGIPALEHNLHFHPEKLNWIKDLPMMFFSSLCTFVSYGCLGAEGPSVVIGGNVALMINDFFKVKDDDSVAIASGAAFGCAFLSPIAGLTYILEETLRKFSFINLFKSVVIAALSYGVIRFMFPHRAIYFEITNFFNVEQWYLIPLIVILNFGFGTLFVFLLVKINNFLKKHPTCFYNKYKVIIYFAITITIAFLLGQYMSSGASFINGLSNQTIWYIVIALALFRLVGTVHGATSSLSGGIVIPQLAIGGAVGMAISLFCQEFFNMPSTFTLEIILLSMLSFYVVVMETPFTGIALLFAFVSFDNAINLLIPGIIIMILSRLISALNRYGDLYDVLKKYLQ